MYWISWTKSNLFLHTKKKKKMQLSSLISWLHEFKCTTWLAIRSLTFELMRCNYMFYSNIFFSHLLNSLSVHFFPLTPITFKNLNVMLITIFLLNPVLCVSFLLINIFLSFTDSNPPPYILVALSPCLEWNN